MIVRAQVYDLIGLVLVKFDSIAYLNMDRRRIKRERNRAIKQWRKGRRNAVQSKAHR